MSKTSVFPMGVILASGLFLHQYAAAQLVTLNSDTNFAILAGSTVTSTGATSVTGGNVGVSPGSAVTGFPPGTVTPPFTIQTANGVTLQAQNDLTTAFNTAAGLARTQNLTGQDLGNMTLTPGVYFFSSSAELTGTLTLNDEGNSDAQFVFQIGSTLTTASGSSVVTINGGTAPGIDVFWQIGSSATLGTGTAFEGNILADASITLDTGATVLDGRLLAENGAVTLEDNTIVVPFEETTPINPINPINPVNPPPGAPDTGSTVLLLGFGVAALCAFKGRFPAKRQG
jgi:type VI secretion system secreted protein VgrG